MGLDFGKKKKKTPKEPKEPKEGDDLTEMFGKKKKKKEKEKEEPEEEEPKLGPTVAKVLEVSAVPKKDKLRVCKVSILEGAEAVDIVTSAPNVIAGKHFIIALPGVTTADGQTVDEAKVSGIESFGMFCGPIQLGWPTDVFDAKHAVMVDDSCDVGMPAPSYEEALQHFKDREKAAAAAAEA